MSAGESRGSALARLAADYAAAGFDTPRAEARRVLLLALGIDPAELLSHPDRPLGAAAERLAACHARRLAHEPISRIAAEREFYGRPFRLSVDTLDPRADSECVVEAALAALAGRPAPRLLDLGTGSGILLLTLLAERPDATGLATDLHPGALAAASANAAALGLSERAEFRQADWLDGIEGPFDLVISNPPYIPTADLAGLDPEVRCYDPRRALDGGADGLDAYRRLAEGALAVLAEGGALVVEHGAGQRAAVMTIFADAGFAPETCMEDLGGRDRAIVFRRASPRQPPLASGGGNG